MKTFEFKNRKLIKKLEKILIPVNIILIIAVILLSMTVINLQAQIDGAFHSIADMRDVRLELDLRNRGIIDGELLVGEYRPYSLEQMEEFKNWVSSHKE